MQNPNATDQYGTLRWFEHEYARVSTDPWGLSWRSSQQLRYQKVLSILDCVKEPLVHAMDVGCATGDFTYLLSRQVRGLEELTGVDFVDDAVERARHRFPQLVFSKEPLLTIGEKYPARFDLITCLEMIYYVPSTEQGEALRSLKGALRPGGYVVFSSMISPPPYFQPLQFRELVESEFEIIRCEVLHLRMISLFEKAGARIAKLAARHNVNTYRFGRLPFRAVVTLERWSRYLKSFAASHTVVLARARS